MIAPIRQNGTLWPTHKSLPMLPALANHHSPRHQPAQVLTWIVGLGQKELSAPSLCHLPPAPRDPKKQLSPYNSKTLNQNRGTYGRIQISYWRPKPPACRISCTSVIARPQVRALRWCLKCRPGQNFRVRGGLGLKQQNLQIRSAQ